MSKRYHIFVSGRVQGVFFRASTQKKAGKLGLTGWVKNLEDGRVEIVAEGEEEKLEELRSWCERGPQQAYVTDLECEKKEATGEFESFEIRY